MKYNPFLLTSGILLLGALPLVPQPAPDSSISITFSALSWGESVTDLYYFNDDKYQSIMVPNASLTTEKTYSGPHKLEFFRKTDPDGTQFTAIASVQIPLDATSVFLVFFPDEQETLSPFRVLSVPASRDNFAAGSARFLNLSTRRLAIQVEGRQFLLTPGSGVETVTPDTQNPHWTLQMAVDNEDAWEMIYRTRWRIYPNQRLLVFLTDSKRGNSPIDLKIIRQAVVESEPELPPDA